MKSVFLKDLDSYQRHIDPINDYIEQTSFYLSVMSGKDIKECETFVKSKINKENGAKNPQVIFYERGDNLDREEKSCSLSSYIKTVNKEGSILAPTLTVYRQPEEIRSFLSDFILDNVKARSIAKKEAFKAKADGEKELFILKNNEQTNKKLYNNSASGAFATKGCILYNPSAHSTLTSTTRLESSLSNANNERLISGNRHYFNYDVTLYNLITLAKNKDIDKLKVVIDKYNLKYPTTEDTISVIKYSTDNYWRDEYKLNKLKDFIDRLSPLQKASIVYVGDLYHIRKYNESFVRDFITKLSTRVIDKIMDDPINFIHNSDEQMVNLAHIVCIEEVRGKGKDYEKMSEKDINTLAATIENINNIVTSYRDFIEAIFLTDNVPPSTAHIKNMVRKAVVLSDTDSTMFSVDEYIEWYFGDIIFTQESYAVYGAIMYIATQAIAHLMTMFSANINVPRNELRRLDMKPEFTFSVFFQSSVSKHYFTSIDIQEGNVFAKPEIEIKGVHLKNSAAPEKLVKAAHERMEYLINTVKSGNKISLVEELNYVKDIENIISDSLISGEVEYYKRSKIKTPESYSTTVEKSPYLHHILWEDVFSYKYGNIDPAPYSVIKIPTILTNITSVKKWLDTITDEDIKSRLSY